MPVPYKPFGPGNEALALVGDEVEAEATPPPEALVHNFGDSSIDFAVRFWRASDIASSGRVRDGVTPGGEIGPGHRWDRVPPAYGVDAVCNRAGTARRGGHPRRLNAVWR